MLLINVFFRWKCSPILIEIAYIQRDPHILDNSKMERALIFRRFFGKKVENVQIRTKGFFVFFRFFELLAPPKSEKIMKNQGNPQ